VLKSDKYKLCVVRWLNLEEGILKNISRKEHYSISERLRFGSVDELFCQKKAGPHFCGTRQTVLFQWRRFPDIYTESSPKITSQEVRCASARLVCELVSRARSQEVWEASLSSVLPSGQFLSSLL
jgi:hypothetical protein